jgi:hypothetical protein
LNWIFQGNPKYFDIAAYLSRFPNLIYWRTPTNQQEIQLGDRAYIWRAGPQAGVVAVGEIVELPIARSEVEFPEALSDELWNRDKPDPDEKVVGIKVDEIRLNEEEAMLSRAMLVSDPVFQENAIVRAPQGTVFRLTSQQAERLSSYWLRKIPSNSESNTREFTEGAVAYRRHKVRERSSALRAEKIAEFRANYGKLCCEICNLEPRENYPEEFAASVLEIHHSKPLSDAKSPRPTTLDELLVLCANCHRAIHSSTDLEENTKKLMKKFGQKYSNGFNSDAG